MGTVGFIAWLIALVEPGNGDKAAYGVGYAIGAYAVPLIIVGVVLWGIFVAIRGFFRRMAKDRQERK
jgi:uncharacterized oligopeptide transporter (OPT) family protein